MQQLIEQIHENSHRSVIAVTGGGASAVARLLAVPGASRTLLDAQVPYCAAALEALLMEAPASACSGATARGLAMVSWIRARALAPGQDVIGVGCTAALTTDRARRGEDRCFIATQSLTETTEVALTFDKSLHDRDSEEQICSDQLIFALARAAGIETDHSVPDRGVRLERRAQTAPHNWQALLDGEQTATLAEASVLFPGAFNPIHEGHLQMAHHAARTLAQPVTLEISVRNVDKPPIDYLEMQARAESIDLPLVFTNAPTFIEKARIFPGTTFVVGTDTISRIAEPRYYEDSITKRDESLKELASLGVRFLVYGREEAGRFVELGDIALPPDLLAICQGVTEAEFRQDISSTDIRSAN